jgi:hypothetical protein
MNVLPSSVQSSDVSHWPSASHAPSAAQYSPSAQSALCAHGARHVPEASATVIGVSQISPGAQRSKNPGSVKPSQRSPSAAKGTQCWLASPAIDSDAWRHHSPAAQSASVVHWFEAWHTA